jgi:hypothetical protein
MTEPLPIYTRVGHTGAQELRFYGKRVFGELLGHTTTMQMLVFGIAGRMLEPDQALLVDDVIVAMSSADPRLWPFKLTRLAASYGHSTYGVAATIIASQGAIFGPTRFEEIARVIVDLHDRAPSDEELETILRGGAVGFGILYGRYDARFDQLVAQLERRGHDGAYSRVARQAVRVARAQLNVEPHVFVAIASLCLDLGMSVAEIGVFGMLPLVHDALANAAEGARQAPAVLQSLPVDRVKYVGPPARLSPRATKA